MATVEVPRTRVCSDRNRYKSPNHMEVDGRTFSAIMQDVRNVDRSMSDKLNQILHVPENAVR